MDDKNRWGGLLEIPVISKIQRNILDFGRKRGLKKSLSGYAFGSVLDIGCGLGETCELFNCPYTGVDNSPPRIAYALKKYPSRDFRVIDARDIPFSCDEFDAVLIFDTSHHLSDDVFLDVLKEAVRVGRNYVVISDPVYFEGQSRISRCFYRLDRGGCFRSAQQMKTLFGRVSGLKLLDHSFFMTFPGLYQHAVFILKIKNPPAPGT